MGRPQELGSLTALRFAAALLVFATHARRILPLDLPAAEIGYVGVSFFFVLSGFVLTWSRRAGESAATFYRHRFARIWPATTLVTLLAILLGSAHQSLPLDLLLLHTWREGSMNGVAANPRAGRSAPRCSSTRSSRLWPGGCRACVISLHLR